MNPTFAEIADHMRGLGLGALAHANWHANYMSFENDYWPELSVLQAAHAAELLIKSRIAQEHPLLIFEQLPRSPDADSPPEIDLAQLVARGRTIQYTDLPDRLWAAAGVRVPDVAQYQEFGRLRNAIQHFVPPPQAQPSEQTIRFIYGVLDRFISECWGLFAIDYNEDYEPYVYLMENLIRRGILFRVSPNAAADAKHLNAKWPEADSGYRTEMEQRIAAALQQQG